MKEYSSTNKLLEIIKNIDYKNNPFYRIRIQKYRTNGAPAGFKDFVYDPYNEEGWQQLWWDGFSDGESYLFAVKGMNFRTDKLSNYTQPTRVDF